MKSKKFSFSFITKILNIISIVASWCASQILKIVKKSKVFAKWLWGAAWIVIEEIAERLNVGQFFFRDGKLFPPYVFSTALVGAAVALIIQRVLGVNEVSDGLIGIVLGGAITYIGIFLHIDNKGEGVTGSNRSKIVRNVYTAIPKNIIE
jgi:hypothetical protein